MTVIQKTNDTSKNLTQNNTDVDLNNYLSSVKNEYSLVNLFGLSASLSQLLSIYVPAPTNCSLDVVVRDGKVSEVTEKRAIGKDITDYTDKRTISYNDNLFHDVEKFLQKNIQNGIEYKYPDHKTHPLIERATWTDGTKKDFWTLNVFDLISLYDKVVILGLPGTGKSTALKYLAVNLARNYLKEQRDNNLQVISDSLFEGRYIPIFVEFRKLSKLINDNKIPRNSETFSLDIVLKYIKTSFNLSDSFIFSNNNNYIFIFDGIDEIPNTTEMRKYFSAFALNQLASEIKHILPNSKMLFSSRVSEYKSFKLKTFEIAEFVNMNDHIAKELVGNICKVLSTFDSPVSETLLDELKSKGFSEDVIYNPMLLSLMTAIAIRNDNNGVLPENKTAILKEGINLLLDRWSIKGDKPEFFKRFDEPAMKEKIFKQLEVFAFNQNENGSIDYQALLNFVIGQKVGEPNDAKNVLDYLSNQVGLIVEEGSNTYRFAHKSFRSYLAASYIIEDKDNLFNNFLEEIDNKLEHGHETTFLAIDLLFDRLSDNAEQYYRILSQIVLDLLSQKRRKSDWCIWFAAQILSNRDFTLFKYIKNQNSFDLNQFLTLLLRAFKRGSSLPLDKRIECGALLGYFGDYRSGVGLIDEEPDIDWIPIPDGICTFGISSDTVEKIKQTYWGGNDYSREQTSNNSTRDVSIHDFEVSKYPITVSQFTSFLRSEDGFNNSKWYKWCEAAMHHFQKRSNNIDSYFGFNLPVEYRVPNYPMTHVSFFDAVAFCKWMTSKSKGQYVVRLPSEFEWEYLAKRNGNCIFEWGDDDVNAEWTSSEIKKHCNALDTGLGRICPVGSFERENDDVSDLIGNAWEWTQSLFSNNLDSINGNRIINVDDNIYIDKTNAKSIMVTNRGGSYLNAVNCLRVSFRGRDPIGGDPADRHSFRVIRTKHDESKYSAKDYPKESCDIGIAEGYGVPIKKGDKITLICYFSKFGSTIQTLMDYTFVLGEDKVIHSIFEEALLNNHRVACNIRMSLLGKQLFGDRGYFDIVGPNDLVEVFIHIKDVSEN